MIVSGKDVGYILPNGIKMNAKINQIQVETPELIRKVIDLIGKKVVEPVQYQKAYKMLSFTYEQKDEDSLGLVLSDIK